MSFELSPEQRAAVREWRYAHTCRIKDARAAIDGRLSYVFTPTTIGDVIVVKCACGQELDVSDYEKW